MFNVFLNGLLTGMLLQLAVGPVFFFILNLSLQRTIPEAMAAILAVTLADYLYIAFAIAGVGKLLENKKLKLILGLFSSFILIIFAIFMILPGDDKSSVLNANVSNAPDYLYSFLSAFLLTISNPLTIVFWTGIFTAKAIEKQYSQKQLIIFGTAAGVSTLIFLGPSILFLSLFKTSISAYIVKMLNTLVGILLLTYAVFRLVKLLKSSSQQSFSAD